MAPVDAAFAATAGGACLALAATLWALAQRRRAQAPIRELTAALPGASGRADAAHASTEAFDSAVVVIEEGGARLASGQDSLSACAAALGLAPTSEPGEVLQALMRSDPDHAARLKGLIERGEACDFEVRA